MTCQLILMRHAKSDHDDPSLSDHDRPLAPRGRRDTPRMADWLADQDRIPELILCSSSVRTRETVQLLIEQWQQKPQVVCCDDLYLSTPQTMLDVIGAENRGMKRVMVMAHNPGSSMLASLLANKSLEMPTAAVAIFNVQDLDELGNHPVSGNAPLSHLIKHLSKQGGYQLTHFASPKTI
ncbi:MAG: histidine phosphatase family protein [Planctomycetales bacterium]|nr:histidine phosphatase family protein [Planctomycetales bacterium]